MEVMKEHSCQKASSKLGKFAPIILPIEWAHGLDPVGTIDPLDPATTFCGIISIAGVLHCVEACGVCYDDDGVQEACCPSENHYNELSKIVRGASSTVTINGRLYAICIYPLPQ